MNLILYNRMMLAKIRVTPFARATGRLLLKIPYKSQRNVPKVKIEYMVSEIALVSLVLIVCIAWGIKEIVVPQAAARPSRVITSIKTICPLR